ncbi:reticulon 4 interacting protein 1 [Trichuris trichiura]|uniref:Reticulon 4 interacting protein 1 n=1 Tax=Trichuris trichiura TaxID=36087 RepID=A0A077Z989_TRITR|nr:reticulon 4 interacting protein 1 [Trichuris trichiura]
MSAWQVQNAAKNSKVELKELPMPILSHPDDVVVKVKAFSVNPIDLRMQDGYGDTIFSTVLKFKKCAPEAKRYPLTLGRDFSGIVTQVGGNVVALKPGDEVFGSISLEGSGTFADYVLTKEWTTAKKPRSVSFAEAASFPHVVTSSWISLVTLGGLQRRQKPPRLFINGGSGGVGTFAIQLGKVYNADVTVSCSADGFKLVKELGANEVVDYKQPDAAERLKQLEKFDIVLNLAGGELAKVGQQMLRDQFGSVYASLVTPLMSDTDEHGLILGLMKSGLTFGEQFIKHAINGQLYWWSYANPDGRALTTVAQLVDFGKIKPVVSKQFPFSETPLALQRLAQGRSLGKIVVTNDAE